MATTTAMDPETAAAIRNALAAATTGRIAEARQIGESALSKGGDPTALNAMLGTFCIGVRDFEGAVRHLRVAYAQRRDDPLIAANLATALVEQGAYAEALDVARPDLSHSDPALRLERIRGYAVHALGDFASAGRAYERIVAANPDDWESWNNLGNSRRAAGDVEGAVDALRRAAAIAPDSPPVRLNLATLLSGTGRAAEAEAELSAMARDFPDDWRSLRELYGLFRSQAREEEALAAIEDASRRNPDDLDLLLAVASQRLVLLDNPGAEAAYGEVVARVPSHAVGNLGLAVVYELSNRTDELARLAGEAEARGADRDVVDIIRAFDHRRGKRFEEGLAALAGVSPEIEAARQAHLLGQLNDGAGHYDAAWTAFSRMNEIQRADPSRPEDRAAAYRQTLRRSLEVATPDWARTWVDVDAGDGRASPAFLVGFPRSGTTLLDTMLMGHPAVEVLEEEPTFQRAAELMADFPNLPTATPELVAAARNAYFEEVAKHTPMAPGKLIVDKNPLLMGAVPLIRRIFPDARIILAIRHPCDVVLSCFTTNFKLNDGMSSFLRLDTTAELYDLCFSYFERVRELMPVNVHEVLYERVVTDREHELESLFDFLGLGWDSNVLDHQATAAKRGRIKTASYAQVGEPIYSRSSGRWHHYRRHLEPVLPILKPWIEKFGYDA
ncbi:tetratricopeptide repeat-containing sulfotransferase family protein [Sphingomonas sp.]|uniref:tetratricopeptide repeat-containing sulfotransferase family protein n=1 Tax=Sphingomonas sp. TaxID=28214 RepID=UPI0025F02E29|nr:tetratricopeptide repeat-containing sulfotransferase family protein [Sphingomonas sp.]MBV9527619.1 sulfotransferase [Sphingomonas sp.]